ncbi:MAG: YhcH/YjgK/YiaL family protein [Segetibacter sp.]
MKKTYTFSILVTLISSFLFLFTSALQAQSASRLSKKKAIKWYNSHVWMNGLKPTPHTSIDKEEFTKEYHARKEWWDKAFAFMKDTDLANLKPGDHPIVGEDVFARVTEVPLKNIDSTKWEAHKNYHDIHYVISGKEKIGIGALSSATIVVPYDSKRDISFYEGTGKYYIADPGTFFIAFTKHIHRPFLEVDGKGMVKKLVIKIRRSGNN